MTRKWWQNPIIYLVLMINLGLVNTKFNFVKAQSTSAIPSELIELTNKIDLAANSQDLESLSQYFSPQFQTSDGLNYNDFIYSLENLWQKYPDLRYRTIIESWEEKKGQLVATTLTTIVGNFNNEGRELNLLSNIRAKHYFEDKKLIEQEILTEKTEITSGEKPPEVIINLPETAKPGSEFDFDVIVTEPLGSDLLLGGALETEVSDKLYTESFAIELDALSSGGIFKRVRIPRDSDDLLYSVILIRADGLRLITQRVKIED